MKLSFAFLWHDTPLQGNHKDSAQPEAATKTNRKDAKGAKSMLDTDLH
jgi:hypothetical protein